MAARTNKVLRKLNISLDTAYTYLMSLPGLEPKKKLTLATKLSDAQIEALFKRFCTDSFVKAKANTLFHNKKNDSKKTIAIENDGNTIAKRVTLSVLHYESHKLFYQIDNETYVLINGDSPAYVKSDAYLEKIANEEIGLVISNSKNSFVFQDAKMLNRLNTLSTQIEKEKHDAHNKLLEEKRKEEREREKEREGKELKEYERNKAKKEIQVKEEKKNIQ